MRRASFILPPTIPAQSTEYPPHLKKIVTYTTCHRTHPEGSSTSRGCCLEIFTVELHPTTDDEARRYALIPTSTCSTRQHSSLTSPIFGGLPPRNFKVVPRNIRNYLGIGAPRE